MDLDCFVYDFVIFSLIDDYDGVFSDLECVEGEFNLAQTKVLMILQGLVLL